jgi:hypothetical protein
MRELRLIAPEGEAYRAAVHELHAQGHRNVHVYPANALAEGVARHSRESGLDAQVGMPESLAAATAPCHILTETDPAALSALLLRLIDVESGVVIAPRTRYACDARPLFLISIPKAGTHLLYTLAEAFGYVAGIVCPEWPRPRHWYCVEYSNSHTRATDFFIDTVRRSPFGNRHHPFATSPALFIYRNPLDILVSEANYYHRDGNAIFGGYLCGRSFEERLLALIDDPWLFGSFRDRMAGFVPWLELSNVIPVSFEELVGARGGGDDAIQRRLIWSLQLKLHVPGSPESFAEQVFDTESPTFNAGRIGSHREKFGAAAMASFQALPQDFMSALGYSGLGATDPARFPSRTEEFMRRQLVVGDETFRDTPILMETGFHDHDIVRYRGRFYGARGVDLAKLTDMQLSMLPSATELAPLRRKLARATALGGRLRHLLIRALRGISA